MFKKFCVIASVLTILTFGAGNAFATGDDNGYPQASGVDISIDGDASSEHGSFDWEGMYNPNGTIGGLSGGIAGADGSSDFSAEGHADEGTVSAEGYSGAGAFTGTVAFEDWDFGPGFVSHGVGSESGAAGFASAGMDVEAANGNGIVSGRFSGETSEGTLNGSIVGTLPGGNTDGFTYGIAGQHAEGEFSGSVGASVSPWGENVGAAYSGQGAFVDVSGRSGTFSSRYLTWGENTRGEGLYSEGFAVTDVETGNNAEWGFEGYTAGWASRGFSGSWEAEGGMALGASQSTEGAFANANADGSYYGSGNLSMPYWNGERGSVFHGAVSGYVNTEITHYDDGFMSGNAVYSGAGMSGTVHNGSFSTPLPE